jgi:hypothetical protein
MTCLHRYHTSKCTVLYNYALLTASAVISQVNHTMGRFVFYSHVYDSVGPLQTMSAAGTDPQPESLPTDNLPLAEFIPVRSTQVIDRPGC